MVIFSRKPVPEKPFTVKHFKNLVLAGNFWAPLSSVDETVYSTDVVYITW